MATNYETAINIIRCQYSKGIWPCDGKRNEYKSGTEVVPIVLVLNEVF